MPSPFLLHSQGALNKNDYVNVYLTRIFVAAKTVNEENH